MKAKVKLSLRIVPQVRFRKSISVTMWDTQRRQGNYFVTEHSNKSKYLARFHIQAMFEA